MLSHREGVALFRRFSLLRVVRANDDAYEGMKEALAAFQVLAFISYLAKRARFVSHPCIDIKIPNDAIIEI